VLGTGTGALEAVAVGVGPAETVGAGVVGAAVAEAVQEGVAPGEGHCVGKTERLLSAGPGFVSERKERRESWLHGNAKLCFTPKYADEPNLRPVLRRFSLGGSKFPPESETEQRNSFSQPVVDHT
jgi:hypothetical protein